ncbi:hypothetical protein [Thermochromatium tepidum]|uniref:Uncharacterized protein n=1 Tax=Thermochromatium tepidum ATCC 43061 TaxID=316276 RepID=A0A6I6EJ97_THETI|nr:hypothetical protein [Thermochromatium tepidum]QGU33187.1 hypothetical protein E6P07_09495 [Thermochromatium tepidum ATCC 43061]
MTPAEIAAFETACAEVCDQVPVTQGPDALAQALQRILPRCDLREALVRGGWYRLGGVVTADGRRLADDLEHWVTETLARYDDDLAAMVESEADDSPFATRVLGKTHYWVARVGPEVTEFLQIELEELQEVISHRLFVPDVAPASLEDLIDPRPLPSPPIAVLGQPAYRLRRITLIREFLAAMREQRPEPQPIHRFVADWQRSSAERACDLANHWVFSLREHLDPYRQPIKHAIPVAALHGTAPRFAASDGARGLDLAEAIARFDRQIGYPMAWFFHLLTTKAVPQCVAATVVEDFADGFAYLPDRDLQIVRDWLHRPYVF